MPDLQLVHCGICAGSYSHPVKQPGRLLHQYLRGRLKKMGAQFGICGSSKRTFHDFTQKGLHRVVGHGSDIRRAGTR